MTTKIKTTLLTAFFFFGLLTGLQAQIPKDSVTRTYSYQGVIKVDSASKQQLYQKTRQWILENLKSGDNIVALDDKEFNSLNASGTILLDKQYFGPFGANSYADAKLNFKATFQFKDGRFKYSFDNFSYSADLNSQTGFVRTVSAVLENLNIEAKIKKAVFADVDSKMKNLILLLSKSVSVESGSKSNDW